MADVTAAPLVAAPAASLWPQPPAQQPGLGSNPSQMLDLLTKVQQNYQLQQELKARGAIGQAYQGALQPDGTLDQEKLRAGLSDPAASWLLPDAMTHVLNQQTSQFNLRSAQDQATRSLIGNIPDNASAEDMRNYAAQLVRVGVPPGLVVGWLNTMPRDPKQMKQWVSNVRTMALSPEAASARVAGPPGMGGEPTTTSLGAANRYDAGGGVAPAAASGRTGGMPVGLSPDQTASIAHMQQDAARQGTFADEMFQWNEAQRAVKKFEAAGGEFGEGSAVRTRFKSFVQTLSPDTARMLGIDPNDVNAYETAKKYLLRAVQSRQQSIGGHTDEQLKTTMGASPNVEMTGLTLNELLKANVAQRRAEYAQYQWAAERGGPGYTTNKADWARHNDIRAFGYDQMTPAQQAKLLDSLKDGSAEYDRFNQSFHTAKRLGLIDVAPPAAAPASAAPATRSVAPAGTKIPDRFTGDARVIGSIQGASGNMPLPSILSESPAPAATTPPVAGARLGRLPDGRTGWVVKGRDGRLHEYVP